MSSKPFRVGLIGFGNIGTGFARQFVDHGELLNERAGRPIELAMIADRDLDRPRNVTLPQSVKLTDDWKEIVASPDIDMIVELVGVGRDGKPSLANEIAEATLKAGKAFTTANKALIATHGSELHRLADQHNAHLYYEATVGAGTPMISPLHTTLVSDRIIAVHGIVNGTTNYILARMEEDSKLSLQKAVEEAQHLGYAEPDPTSDVEGDDAVYKISILSSLAFGKLIRPLNVIKEGIMRLSSKELSIAKERGWALKLLASGYQQDDGRVAVMVRPVFLPADHILSAVKSVYNAVYYEAVPAGGTLYYGAGAGQPSTSSGLWSDCIMASRCQGHQNLFPLRISSQSAEFVGKAELEGNHYFRLPAECMDFLKELEIEFEEISRGETGVSILTGSITEQDVDNLIGKLWQSGVSKDSVCHVRFAFS